MKSHLPPWWIFVVIALLGYLSIIVFFEPVEPDEIDLQGRMSYP